MTVSLPPALLLPDLLCCLGLGLLVALLYDLARLFLGTGRAALFLLDLAAFLLAALLECSFAASRSASGVPRWYMAAGLLAGAVGYGTVVSPLTRVLELWLRWLVTRPFLLALLPFRGAGWCLAALWRRFEKKRRHFVEKQQKKKLKRERKVLYNTNI